MNYQEKLKDPRWQRKRLEIMNRDGFKCRACDRSTVTLHVHHAKYADSRLPWDGDDNDKITLCEDCHERVEISNDFAKKVNNFIGSFGLKEDRVNQWNQLSKTFLAWHQHAVKQVEKWGKK